MLHLKNSTIGYFDNVKAVEIVLLISMHYFHSVFKYVEIAKVHLDQTHVQIFFLKYSI